MKCTITIPEVKIMSNVIEITAKGQLEEKVSKKCESLLMMLKGMPHPAWLISNEFRILEQNDYAKTIFNKNIGDFCWKDMSEAETGFFEKYKDMLISEPIKDEVELSGIVWDTCWIPLGSGIYMYYAINVTESKRRDEELLKLSMEDSLTRIYNRKTFMKHLEKQIRRANENKIHFSLIMFEIDNFKKINETYGYDMADLVLKKCVNEIEKYGLRKEDRFARWGGKEFIIMLPGVTVERAAELAESFRKRINQIEITEIGGMTASFGVAGFSLGEDIDELLERTDTMMQRARKEGKNCVRATKKTSARKSVLLK